MAAMRVVCIVSVCLRCLYSTFAVAFISSCENVLRFSGAISVALVKRNELWGKMLGQLKLFGHVMQINNVTSSVLVK